MQADAAGGKGGLLVGPLSTRILRRIAGEEGLVFLTARGAALGLGPTRF
jgi:hypothetical protein